MKIFLIALFFPLVTNAMTATGNCVLKFYDDAGVVTAVPFELFSRPTNEVRILALGDTGTGYQGYVSDDDEGNICVILRTPSFNYNYSCVEKVAFEAGYSPKLLMVAPNYRYECSGKVN